MQFHVVLASLTLASAASAQTALLREADAAPGSGGSQIIDSIGVPAVNQQGGYACSIESQGPFGDTWQLWGNLDGGPGSILRQEATIGCFEQTVFESRFGITDSVIAYSGTATDLMTNTTGLDTVWLDDVPVMIEDQSVPNSPDFWTFAQSTALTTSGVPYFRGGITSTLGIATERRGIFMGVQPAALYLTGDILPNMPFELSTVAVDADFRFSADGTHNIVPVDLESGSSTDDGAIAIDGVGLLLGGTLVREGEPIPASIGGMGDNWDNFDALGITESGEYMFTGDTDGGSQTDEFIVRNGTIWAREGDILGGEMLSGSLSGASMNELGDIAFVWGIDVGPGIPDDALFFEDEILLREGDAVDWDGDGVIDPAVTIDGFTGTNSITLSRDGMIYFTADVNVGGAELEGFFAIETPIIGLDYCSPNLNSSGLRGLARAFGSASVAQNDVTLSAESLPPFAFGFFITSQTQGLVVNPAGSAGNLCVLGDIGRYVGPGQIQSSGASGFISLAIDLTNTPQPTGSVAVQPGEEWNFQLWHRDQGPAGPSSNFTNGLTILFN